MHCSACGAQNQSSDFCTSCGMRQPGGAQPAAAPTPVPVPSAAAPPGETSRPGNARGVAPEAYLSLQRSEEAVVHAASRIYAAYIASGQVTDDIIDDMVARSVRTAIKMTTLADKLVQSDDEEW